MKVRRFANAALLSLALGCSGPAEPEQRVLMMDVGSELVDCHGFIEQQCLRVSIGPGGPWILFYEQIEGFTFEPGFEYTLRVERQAIPPVLDGSSFRWRLLDVLRKVPAAGMER
jgi:hypothetical protein